MLVGCGTLTHAHFNTEEYHPILIAMRVLPRFCLLEVLGDNTVPA